MSLMFDELSETEQLTQPSRDPKSARISMRSTSTEMYRRG